jgi:hypothetical protein
LDDDGSSGRRAQPILIGRDVGDGVGCCGAGVELDGVHWCAVEVGGDAEVEVGLRAGNLCADLDDGGVGLILLQKSDCGAFPTPTRRVPSDALRRQIDEAGSKAARIRD